MEQRNSATERIVYGDVIDKLFDMKAELDGQALKASQIMKEMLNSIMAFKQDYFAQIESEGGEIDTNQIDIHEAEIKALYTKDIDAANQNVNMLREQICQKIIEIKNRVIISNELLAKLVSNMEGSKWSIIEGGDVWQDMDKRCSLTGLYAINENNKFYGRTFKQYQKIRREAYNSQTSQFETIASCSAPKDIVNSDGFCILAEEPLKVEEGYCEQLQQRKGFSQAKISRAKNQILSDYQKALLSINWFEAYLKQKIGLTSSDEFYGGAVSTIDLKDENCVFKKLAYKAIDGHIEDLRANSFALK